MVIDSSDSCAELTLYSKGDNDNVGSREENIDDILSKIVNPSTGIRLEIHADEDKKVADSGSEDILI